MITKYRYNLLYSIRLMQMVSLNLPRLESKKGRQTKKKSFTELLRSKDEGYSLYR